MAGVGNQVKRAGTSGGEWTLLKNVKGEKMGRRVPMLLAAMAVMVALFAAAAYAAQIEGTDQNETLIESNRNDKIEGKDGEDTLEAFQFGPAGTIDTSPIGNAGDRDLLSGGRHADNLNATDGDVRDVVDGGRGFDTCSIDVDIEGGESDEFKSCRVINGVSVEEFLIQHPFI